MFFDNKICTTSKTIFQFLTLGILLISCTRAPDEASKISFSLPQKPTSLAQSVSAQNFDINYVAINVTAADMPAIFCSYDIERGRKQGPCVFTGMPATPKVQLELPIGDKRLIQVLAGYRDETADLMKFEYGDSTANLTAGEASVNIQLTATSATAEGAGHIQGRYFTGANVGPSGLLRVKVKGHPDKPALVLQETEIYSGWFNAFSLQNTKFEYEVNGTVLFGKAMNKTEFQSLSGINTTHRVSASTDFEVWGFFGDLASNAGKSAASTGCGSPVYSECLGSSNRFVGPFKLQGSGNYLQTIGNHTIAEWELLPGVDRSVIDGVVLLRPSVPLLPEQLENIVLNHGFDCELMKSVPGVQVLGEDPVINGVSYMDFTLPGSMPPDPTRPLVACPKKGLTLLTSAVSNPMLDQDGSCSTCKYLRIDLTDAQFDGDVMTVARGGCYRINTSIYEGMGVSYNVSGGNLNFDISALGWGTFHQTMGCTDTATTSMSDEILNGASTTSTTRYIKITGAASTGKQFAIANISGGGGAVVSYQAQHNTANIVQPQLFLAAPTTMLPGVCYKAQIRYVLPNGSPVGSAFSGSVDLDIATGSSEFSIYQSANMFNCEEDDPSVTSGYQFWPSSMPLNVIVRKQNAGSHSLTMTSSTSGVPAKSFNIVGGSGSLTPTGIRILNPPAMIVGQCYAIEAELVNSQGAVVPAVTSTQIYISNNVPGSFHMSMGCSSGGGNPSFYFMQGDSRAVVYFKPNRAESFNFQSLVQGSLAMVSPTFTPSLGSGSSQPASLYFLNPPKFPKGDSGFQTYIGSHNFNGASGYLLNYSVTPANAAVTCTEDNGMSWGNCSGRLDTTAKTFRLLHSDIPTMSTKLKVTPTSGPMVEVSVHHLFEGGMVTDCDQVHASGTTFQTIDTLGGSTVCLESGSFSKGAGALNSIPLSSGDKFLGKVDFVTGELLSEVVATTSNPIFDIAALAGSNTYIHGIKFNLSAINSKGIGHLSGYPTGNLSSQANIFNHTNSQSESIAIYVDGASTNFSVSSRHDLFKVNSAFSNSMGIRLVAGNHEVRNSRFQMTSGASSIAKGIVLNGNSLSSAQNLYLDYTSFTGGGNALYVIGDDMASSYSPQMTITGISIQNNNTHSAGYSIYLQNKLSFSIENSSISQTAGNLALIKHAQLDAIDGQAVELNLRRSYLRQGGNEAALVIYSAASSVASPPITMTYNHFVKTGGSSSNAAIKVSLDGGNVDAMLDVDTTSIPAHGYNLFCSTGGGFNWATSYDMLAGSSNIASGPEAFAPPAVSAQGAAVGSAICSHAN